MLYRVYNFSIGNLLFGRITFLMSVNSFIFIIRISRELFLQLF